MYFSKTNWIITNFKTLKSLLLLSVGPKFKFLPHVFRCLFSGGREGETNFDVVCCIKGWMQQLVGVDEMQAKLSNSSLCFLLSWLFYDVRIALSLYWIGYLIARYYPQSCTYLLILLYSNSLKIPHRWNTIRSIYYDVHS